MSTVIQPPRPLSPKQVALRFGVSVDSIRRLVKSGKLPAVDLTASGGTRKRRYVIDEADAIEFYNRQRTARIQPTLPPRRSAQRLPPVPKYV